MTSTDHLKLYRVGFSDSTGDHGQDRDVWAATIEDALDAGAKILEGVEFKAGDYFMPEYVAEGLTDEQRRVEVTITAWEPSERDEDREIEERVVICELVD
jgi:hypothetical protein